MIHAHSIFFLSRKRKLQWKSFHYSDAHKKFGYGHCDAVRGLISAMGLNISNFNVINGPNK